MGDCTRRAQHFHDLALEFLVLTRMTTAAHRQENYRLMGQHYLDKARAELARAKRPATDFEGATISPLPQSL